MEVLLLCSKQEIGFQGHDESAASLNKGNFLAKHNKVIEDRLKNAKYTSHMNHHINYGHTESAKINLMANYQNF